MAVFFLQLLLVSVTTGLVILGLRALSFVLDRAFVVKWKYWIWLVLAVRLLIPVYPALPLQPVEIDLPKVSEGIEKTYYLPPSTFIFDGMYGYLGQAMQLGYDHDYVHIGMQFTGENKEWFLSEYPESVLTELAEPSGGNAWWVSHGWNDLNARRILETGCAVWIAGAFLWLGYHAVAGLIYQKRLLRWCREPEGAWLSVVREAAGDGGIPSRVKVLVSSGGAGPMVIGLFCPKLILPEREYDRMELRFILRHELIHYRRHDLWYKALLLLVNATHWFNPAVYLMCREAARDLECSCDSAVVAGIGPEERRFYMGVIMAKAARTTGSSYLSSNFHGGKGQLKKRLTNILDMGRRQKGIFAFAAFLLMALILASLVKQPIEGKTADYNWAENYGDVPGVPEEELMLSAWIDLPTYEEIAGLGTTVMYEGDHDAQDGFVRGPGGSLPGTGMGDWYCVTYEGVEYIYGKHDGEWYEAAKGLSHELYSYAIVDENIVLGNGFRVGLSRQEVLDLCPEIRDALVTTGGEAFTVWNGSGYPDCWAESFDYAMVVEMDDGVNDNLAIYLALLMRDDTVCAITPYAPMAG